MVSGGGGCAVANWKHANLLFALATKINDASLTRGILSHCAQYGISKGVATCSCQPGRLGQLSSPANSHTASAATNATGASDKYSSRYTQALSQQYLRISHASAVWFHFVQGPVCAAARPCVPEQQ